MPDWVQKEYPGHGVSWSPGLTNGWKSRPCPCNTSLYFGLTCTLSQALNYVLLLILFGNNNAPNLTQTSPARYSGLHFHLSFFSVDGFPEGENSSMDHVWSCQYGLHPNITSCPSPVAWRPDSLCDLTESLV